MQDKTHLNRILNTLDQQKSSFLSQLESEICNYISNQSTGRCLTFVTRDSYGSVVKTYEPSNVTEGYIGCLTAFLRKRPYKGYTVDSALTDDIVNRVTLKFEKLYEKNTEAISKEILNSLLQDKVFVNSFVENILESSNQTVPQAIKSQLSSLLIDQLQHSLDANVSGNIAIGISKVVGVVATIPITKTLAILLMKNCAILLKGTMAKILASTAFKTMMAATAKKLVGIKIVGFIVTFLGTKFGIVLGGSAFMFILIPLVVGIIAREFIVLPDKMGNKISEGVRESITGTYREINRDIMTEVLKDILKTGAGAFAGKVLQDPEVQNALNHLYRKAV